MKYCKVCGSTLPDKAVFCNKCGAKIESDISATDEVGGNGSELSDNINKYVTKAAVVAGKVGKEAANLGKDLTSKASDISENLMENVNEKVRQEKNNSPAEITVKNSINYYCFWDYLEYCTYGSKFLPGLFRNDSRKYCQND